MIRSLLAALALAALACQATVSGSLPGDASPELRYYAAKEDYHILQGDLNAYIALPSTTRAEAEAIDAVLDEAEAELEAFEQLRAAGAATDGQFGLQAAALRTTIRVLCARPNVQSAGLAACAGR